MTDKRDAQGKLLPDSQRLTKFGKMLRATSLDELPELFNIWKGRHEHHRPRPLLVPTFPGIHRRRAAPYGAARPDWPGPGIGPEFPGLGYVPGQGCGIREEASLAMDLKVLWKTVMVVFDHSEVAEDTSAAEGNLAEIRSKRQEREKQA